MKNDKKNSFTWNIIKCNVICVVCGITVYTVCMHIRKTKTKNKNEKQKKTKTKKKLYKLKHGAKYSFGSVYVRIVR